MIQIYYKRQRPDKPAFEKNCRKKLFLCVTAATTEFEDQSYLEA